MFLKLDKLEVMENSQSTLFSIISTADMWMRSWFLLLNLQVNLLNDCEKWAKFNDEQKSTFINPFHFSPLSPLPNDVVVEALKINSAPLSKADGQTILKKRKEEEKQQTLKMRMSEINDHQLKVKKATDLSKKKQ